MTQAMEVNFILRSDVLQIVDLGLDNTDQQSSICFEALPGQWHADVERRDLGSSWGMRPAFLLAWHESLGKPDSRDKHWAPLGIRLHSETGIIAVSDDKFIKEDNLQLYQDAIDLLEESDFLALTANAIGLESALSHGDFPLSAIRDETNRIQAICINFGLAAR
ncbi:hypothetical protein [Pelagibaculum spongiae]|uniref:hypothetical protein n=1 Tax=Pelagibaculum spongiae TaxID=2080658 RepID=UPI0010576C27|nr:hypothetical protein [Pelagibaculum spongiae]